MATGMPDTFELQDLVTEEEAGFVRSFRRELHAAKLFSYTPTQSISTLNMKWREISDAGKVRITMDFPALEAQDGLTVTSKEVEIPLFTKDLTYGGRMYDAYRAGGLDLEDARQAGLAMAEEINDYLYFGANGGNVPGPGTGLLNTAGQLTVDNSASTDWNNPTDVSDDMSEAIRKLLVAGHTADNLVLLMNPADSDLMMRWRVETDRQTKDILPPQVGQPLWERRVDVNTAYLIAVSPDNYDAVGPFAPGEVRTMVDDPGMDGLMMGKQIHIRHMAAIAPRIKREDCVVKITFDRA